MNRKKSLQKVLCVALAVVSVFSTITPISYSGSLISFPQPNGFWRVDIIGEVCVGELKNFLEEKNKGKTGTKSLWEENMLIGFSVKTEAHMLSPCPNTLMAIVPKNATIGQVYTEIPWLKQWLLCNRLTLRSFTYIDGETSKTVAAEEANNVQLGASQDFAANDKTSVIQLNVVNAKRMRARIHEKEKAARLSKLRDIAKQPEFKIFFPPAMPLPERLARTLRIKNTNNLRERKVFFPKKYEVLNGIHGVDLDVFLHLLLFAKDVSSVCAILGGSEETWRIFKSRQTEAVLRELVSSKSFHWERLKRTCNTGFSVLQQIIANRRSALCCSTPNFSPYFWFLDAVSHALVLLQNIGENLNCMPWPTDEEQLENVAMIGEKCIPVTWAKRLLLNCTQNLGVQLVGAAVTQKLETDAKTVAEQSNEPPFATCLCVNHFPHDDDHTIEQIITLLFYYLYTIMRIIWQA
ncbi:hypothetical protein FACS1894198_0990 [Clostridia bacterium]|nr:hypothetical protein FACS1894198_0990 [Clostridia bacterium]